MCRVTGACFVGVCRVTGACFVGVCRVTGACFVGVCRVTGASFVGVCRVTGACFVGVCRVTGACFVGVCRVTGAHCGQFVCLPSLICLQDSQEAAATADWLQMSRKENADHSSSDHVTLLLKCSCSCTLHHFIWECSETTLGNFC